MKMKKLLCLAMGLGMAFSAAACGGNSSTSNNSSTGGGNSGETIKLTVWCPEADHEFAKKVAEDYKKANPDKTYKFFFGIQGENDAATKVLNDVTNAPDVFSFPSDQINRLINGDALARIGGSRLDTVKANNSADAVDSATVTVEGEERTYAMPYTDNTFFLYYNKSVFSEEDVKTLDGILAKCTAPDLEGKNGKQFAMPLNDGWYSTSFYFGEGLGYEVTFDDAFGETQITCDFANDKGKAVTQALWETISNPKVKPDTDDSKSAAGFQDGSIVAAVSGIWNKTTFEKYLGEDFAVAKLPTYTLNRGAADEKQVQLVSFAGYKLLGISNYSKNKAEAMSFAEFYSNKQNQLLHFDLRGFVPTNLEAQQEERVKNDACAKAITAQLQHTKAQKNVPSTLWTPMQGLGDGLIALISSGATADQLNELLTNAVSQIEKQPAA